MKDDKELKDIESYLNDHEFILTIGMSRKIQVGEYEPLSFHEEIAVSKTIEDEVAVLQDRALALIEHHVREWEFKVRNKMKEKQEIQEEKISQTAMKDVVEQAGDGGKCEFCGAIKNVWREGGISKITGKPYPGFWSCPDYNPTTHKK